MFLSFLSNRDLLTLVKQLPMCHFFFFFFLFIIVNKLEKPDSMMCNYRDEIKKPLGKERRRVEPHLHANKLVFIHAPVQRMKIML